MEKKLYSEVIASYDVTDNKRRRKVFEALKDLGLTPIQHSVFHGWLTTAEKKEILIIFEKFLKKDNDKAFFVNCNLSKKFQDRSFGHKISELQELKNYDSV